jgi:hypothetical protein
VISIHIDDDDDDDEDVTGTSLIRGIESADTRSARLYRGVANVDRKGNDTGVFGRSGR